MTLFIAAALLTVAVVLYVLLPILQDRRASLESSADDLSDAQAQKRVALMALRDAEYDYATGKLGDEDYEELRQELSVEALQALRNEELLEQPETQDSTVPGEVAAPDDAEAKPASPEEPRGSAELEAEVARVRAGLQSGDTCGQCGHVNRAGGSFCTSCGRPLGRTATAVSG